MGCLAHIFWDNVLGIFVVFIYCHPAQPLHRPSSSQGDSIRGSEVSFCQPGQFSTLSWGGRQAIVQLPLVAARASCVYFPAGKMAQWRQSMSSNW